MGSPVSAVIAELVMEYPRRWRRYVDDSNACVRSRDLDRFHRHLNSVNPHIQFTVKHVTMTDGKPTIASLDTKCQSSLMDALQYKYIVKPHTRISI